MPHPTKVTARGLLIAFASLAPLLGLGGCDDEDDPVAVCNGDRCFCVEGEECAVPCNAPPCKLTCTANNPSCVGDCANGDCECGPGSNCTIGCAAPPCHLDCNGSASCEGTCANGTCACNGAASCDFDCLAGPCQVECGPDTQCSGVCANGTCRCGAGSECLFRCLDDNCKYECAAGDLVECPDGVTRSCGGADCPAAAAE